VPEAIRKATEAARRSLVRVPLREGRTLHHDSEGRHGAGKVVLRSAPPGTGIIAGGPMRAVFEMLGVQRSPVAGAPTPTTTVRATFDGLKHQEDPRCSPSRQESGDIVAAGRLRRGGPLAKA
jgi:small subunit ribosomal protein S5